MLILSFALQLKSPSLLRCECTLMRRVKCPCGTILSVKMDSAEIVQCPKCSKKLRLAKQSPSEAAGASDATEPRPRATNTPQPPSSPAAAVQPQTTWPGMLNESRQRFGNAPRAFSDDEKAYLRVKFSFLTRLLSSADKLCQPLAAQESVFRDGVIVWGHLIQANNQLFQPGKRDLPGEMVYALNSPNITPEELGQVAAGLGSLKGTRPASPALAPIANYLTDEYIRVFGLPVPPAISAKPCMISTVYFVRHHLPNWMLSDGLMPLVVSPRTPHFAFVLPALYWPEMLLQHWQAARPVIRK